jgi:hypothetical protein
MTNPLATWNPAAGVWETEVTGLCGHSARFLETWPASGSMRNGSVYARPTPAPRTAGSASSSSPGLLPTPMTSDARAKGPADVGRNSPQLRAISELLPTPTVSDANGPGVHGDGGTDLRTSVSLLPTPRATDGTNGGPNQRGSSGDLMLPSAVMLLPTPRAQNGEERNQTIWARDPSEPQNLGNALAFVLPPKPREATDPPPGDGRHGKQLSIEED